MLNDKATQKDLIDYLFYRLPAEVTPADTVVIFFSGHGAPDTVTDTQGNVETFLLPIDADPAAGEIVLTRVGKSPGAPLPGLR